MVEAEKQHKHQALTSFGAGRLGSCSMTIFLASSRFFSLLSAFSACSSKRQSCLPSKDFKSSSTLARNGQLLGKLLHALLLQRGFIYKCILFLYCFNQSMRLHLQILFLYNFKQSLFTNRFYLFTVSKSSIYKKN